MGKWNWKELKPEIAQVWRLSLPAILTQITTIVMQYIDSAMVGRAGRECFRVRSGWCPPAPG